MAGHMDIELTPLIRRGGVVAEDGPAIEPSSGCNVLGQEVACPLPNIQVVRPGEHIRFDEQSQQMIAEVSGYPVIERRVKGAVEQLVVGIDPLVTVSPDKMMASLALKPAPIGHVLPDLVTIHQVLDEEQVVFGRNPDAIVECLAQCAVEGLPQSAVVALGTLPTNGEDAWL